MLPSIIENLSFEAIFREKLSRFTQYMQGKIPGFKEPLPADPSYAVLSELSFSEVIIREKINQAAYTQLLRYTQELESIFDGQRRVGESYEDFRLRMRNRKHEASAAGSIEQYKALSFLFGEASRTVNGIEEKISVVDAYVESVKNPDSGERRIFIHVMPSSEEEDLKKLLLKAIEKGLSSERIRPALDEISVIEASITPYIVTGTLTLEPAYDDDYAQRLIENMKKAFHLQRKLGWAAATSWFAKELHAPGVRSVLLTSPVSDQPVEMNSYGRLELVALDIVRAKR